MIDATAILKARYRRRRLTLDERIARITQQFLAGARGIIRERAEREHAADLRDHPYKRSCVFCGKRHVYPRLVLVIGPSSRERRRWASQACINRKFGERVSPSAIVRVYR